MKTYKVKEIFLTLQGEGYHAGTAAVFVRFAGCNVWSGKEEHRERDTARGLCAAWCDTDFVGGEALSGQDIVSRVRASWKGLGCVRVVFTGGEPSLQLDNDLVTAFKLAMDCHLAVETNGSHPLPPGIDWICLSPKPPLPSVVQRYDEVKVVYPALYPWPWAMTAPHKYIQPQAGDAGAVQQCIAFVKENPQWKLSIQAHKLLGIP